MFSVIYVANPPGNPVATLDHWIVKGSGKDTYTKALATSAGLNIFFPNPPNTSFPNSTPNMIPTTAIHIGVLAGKVNTYNMQVTNMASETFLSYCFSNIYSVPTPNKVTHKSNTKDRQPKKINRSYY